MPVKKYKADLSDLPEESDIDVEDEEDKPKKFNYAGSQSKVKAGYAKSERVP